MFAKYLHTTQVSERRLSRGGVTVYVSRTVAKNFVKMLFGVFTDSIIIGWRVQLLHLLIIERHYLCKEFLLLTTELSPS